MSDMMFDRQHDARIGFGEATVNTRTSAKPAALRHNPRAEHNWSAIGTVARNGH
jgi:hypothetical protein